MLDSWSTNVNSLTKVWFSMKEENTSKCVVHWQFMNSKSRPPLQWIHIYGSVVECIYQLPNCTNENCSIHKYNKMKENNSYFLDGISEGKLCKVWKTFSTSPSLSSGFTSPGTDSSTQSCFASRKCRKLHYMEGWTYWVY